MSSTTLAEVLVTSIDLGDRGRKQYQGIEELANSIRQQGLIHPVAVKANKDGTYKLLAGGRRMMAISRLGAEKVMVRIFPEELSDLDARTIELIENIQREDLSWAEKIHMEQRIDELQVEIYGKKNPHSGKTDAQGWSQADTARLLNRSKASISLDISLAKALKAVPELAKCKTKDEARKLLEKAEREVVDHQKASEIMAVETNIAKKKLLDAYMISDFFVGIRGVAAKSIDVVEMDPPYGIDLKNAKKLSTLHGDPTTDYKEIDPNSYISFLKKAFKEIYRVMKDDSWLIVWFGPEPWFDTIIQELRSAGFFVKGIPAIWAKGSAFIQTMQPKYNLANAYEMFFYARKGKPEINKQGRANVYMHDSIFPAKKVHPTEKPIALMSKILRTFGRPGCKVLVPFLGSGNTLLAASDENMHGFGFELSEEYKDGFAIKVSEGIGSYSPGF